MKKLNPTQHPI